MSDERFCKTCRHLRRVELPEYDDYAYYCGWRKTLERSDFPWAEALLAALLAATAMKNGCSWIGKRHVEGDWSEVMDCAKWERRETAKNSNSKPDSSNSERKTQ